MSLTKEQLLIPRVMCTGEEKGKRLYPHSEVYVGEILTLDPSGYTYASDTGKWVGKAQVADFPHLFRPMPWWEGRKPEDMPEYIKYGHGAVYKVEDWRENEHYGIYAVCERGEDYPLIMQPHTKPATEQEYNEYQKQKNF